MAFFRLKADYKNHLAKVENRVAEKDRPYIYIPIKLNNLTYLAPLSSVKKWADKPENDTFQKIISKNKYLGIVHVNNMIPVGKNINYYAEKIDLSLNNSKENPKYVKLLLTQSRVINSQSFQKRLKEKASKIYTATKEKKPKKYEVFLKKLSNNLTKLEEALKEYDHKLQVIREVGTIKNNKFAIKDKYRGLVCEELKDPNANEKKIVSSPSFIKKFDEYQKKRLEQQNNLVRSGKHLKKDKGIDIN